MGGDERHGMQKMVDATQDAGWDWTVEALRANVKTRPFGAC